LPFERRPKAQIHIVNTNEIMSLFWKKNSLCTAIVADKKIPHVFGRSTCRYFLASFYFFFAYQKDFWHHFIVNFYFNKLFLHLWFGLRIIFTAHTLFCISSLWTKFLPDFSLFKHQKKFIFRCLFFGMYAIKLLFSAAHVCQLYKVKNR
jgi:hypothetical protein